MQTRLQSTRVRGPPPPPPRRDGTLDAQDDDDFVQVSVMERPSTTAPSRTDRICDDNNNNNSKEEWLLRVRMPTTPSTTTTTLVSIHVTSEMTARTLAACLQQSMPFLQQPIVGLFQESRAGHFYTLEHVLQTKEREVIYTVQLTLPSPSPPKSIPWYQHVNTWWLMFACVPILFWILRYYLPIVLYLVHYFAIWLYKSMVQLPLVELYRHGPWMVGWEGTPLPQICSRITYHGDEVFWGRNLEECQRIFLQKQDAWLKVAQPLWWAVLLGLFLFTVRWIIASFRHPPTPVDRDMVETYRAWQILWQQASKTFHQPPRIQPPQHFEKQGQIQFYS